MTRASTAGLCDFGVKTKVEQVAKSGDALMMRIGMSFLSRPHHR
jgi:hypothetical protein